MWCWAFPRCLICNFLTSNFGSNCKTGNEVLYWCTRACTHPVFSLAAAPWGQVKARPQVGGVIEGLKGRMFLFLLAYYYLRQVEFHCRCVGMMDSSETSRTSVAFVHRGTFVHSTPEEALQILEDALVGVDDRGKVCLIYSTFILNCFFFPGII